jgi:hypothetical protein
MDYSLILTQHICLLCGKKANGYEGLDEREIIKIVAGELPYMYD